jgi:hypothetical protein
VDIQLLMGQPLIVSRIRFWRRLTSKIRNGEITLGRTMHDIALAIEVSGVSKSEIAAVNDISF